jgi:hypothetical protein
MRSARARFLRPMARPGQCARLPRRLALLAAPLLAILLLAAPAWAGPVHAAPLRGVVFADGKKGYSFTLPTGNDGRYAFWAPSGASPFKMTASANGWIPQTAAVSIKGGKTTTVNFTLRPTSC